VLQNTWQCRGNAPGDADTARADFDGHVVCRGCSMNLCQLSVRQQIEGQVVCYLNKMNPQLRSSLNQLYGGHRIWRRRACNADCPCECVGG
jgi:hypothetical protein